MQLPTMPKIQNVLHVLLGVVLLLAVQGCNQNKRGPANTNSPSGNTAGTGQSASQSGGAATHASPLTRGSGYVHATFQPNVRVMEDEEGRKALIGVSSNDAGLLLDASNATARQLKAGDVLVIKGLLARAVLAAETTPDGIIVLTQQAAISDLIQDGEISVTAPVRFGTARAGVPTIQDRWFASLQSLFVQPAYAQSPEGVAMQSAEAKGTKDAYGNLLKGAAKAVIEGWETSYDATPGEGQTNLTITVKKDVGGFIALITGQGYISGFDFDSQIGVQKGTVQRVETTFNNLNGRMNFQWVVSKDSPGVMADESRIKLPGAIEVPLSQFVEGIPLYLEVSAALLIHPAITGGKEYSKGQFRLSYDGSQHFTMNPGNIDSNGNVTGDIELLEHQELSPAAPLGMVVAFAAPRIELTLGLSKIYDNSDIKKAADLVDKYADSIAKRLLSPAQYQAYQNGPLGGFKLGDTFKNALSTDGAAFFEMIGTSGSSYTGSSTVTPCSRYDLSMVAKVGASARVWGQQAGGLNKDIFNKSITKVDPPGMKLCENIGKS